MDDVLCQVLLAAGDPDLLAGDLVGTIGLRHRLGADQTEICAALGLGEVHGAGPFAGRHVRPVNRFQFVRRAGHQRLIGAMGQARIHGEGHVRRGGHLRDRHVQNLGQALAAHLRIGRQQRPAVLDKGFVGRREPVWRLHAGIVATDTALLVADHVQRLEHFLGELAAFGQYRVDHVARGVGKAGQVGIFLDFEHVMQHELHVANGGIVTRHSRSLSRVWDWDFGGGTRLNRLRRRPYVPWRPAHRQPRFRPRRRPGR